MFFSYVLLTPAGAYTGEKCNRFSPELPKKKMMVKRQEMKRQMINQIRKYIDDIKTITIEQLTIQIMLPLLCNWSLWQKKPVLAPVPLLLPPPGKKGFKP